MNPADARAQATRQWNANPCGAVKGGQDDLRFFLEVERERYRQQAWQHDYFRFNNFSGANVLEIGVGLGTDLIQFANGGARCHAIDITDSHLELASRNFRLRGLPVVLKKCDATAIDFADAYFDLIYSFGVIHHIPDADRVMREIRRVLKPGGTCMMALYHKWSAFHIVSWLLRQGILKGDLFRLGYDGLLAKIEQGADGVAIKPYVKLYTRRSMRELLNGMSIRDISIRQLSPSHFSPRFAWPAFRPITPFLEPALGWYVTAIATRPLD